jgi:hypothetical protein
MAHKIVVGASELAVRGVALPQHAATYTVIPNALAIDESRKQLAKYGFTIAREEYTLGSRDEKSGEHQVAMGRYFCEMPGAPMGFKMVLLWVNSYDKSMRFKVGIGVHLEDANVDIIKGTEGSSFRRKHTGKADEEVIVSLDEKLQMHQQLFQEIMDDKAAMEAIQMGPDRQALFLGKGFLEWELLTSEQMNAVKRSVKKPVYLPECHTAWCFYVRMLMGCAREHPKTYVETFRALHSKIMHFMVSGFPNLADATVDVPLKMDASYGNVPEAVVQEQLKLNAEVAKDEPKPSPIVVTPNQISLLDEIDKIAEVVRESTFDIGDEGVIEIPPIPVIQPPKELPVEVKVKKDSERVESIGSVLFQEGFDTSHKPEIVEEYQKIHGYDEIEDFGKFRSFVQVCPDVQQYRKNVVPVTPISVVGMNEDGSPLVSPFTSSTPASRLDAIEAARKAQVELDPKLDIDAIYHKAVDQYGETLAKLAESETPVEDEREKVSEVTVSKEVHNRPTTLVAAFESNQVEEITVEEAPIPTPVIVIPQSEWEEVDMSKPTVGQPAIYDYKIIEGKLHKKLKVAVVIEEDLDGPDFFAAPEPGRIVDVMVPTPKVKSIDLPVIPVTPPMVPPDSNVSPFL